MAAPVAADPVIRLSSSGGNVVASAAVTFVHVRADPPPLLGPDGNLYAAGHGPVLRYDIITGSLIDDFTHGHDLAEDGALFVANASNTSGNILRFNPPSSRARAVNNFSSAVFATYPGLTPLAIAFGPDQNLYVSNSDGSGNGGGILRFDGRTGAFIDVFVPAVEGGPRGIVFAPGPN